MNYGIDRVRFTAPVPSGSRVRLKAKLLGSEPKAGGVVYRIGAEGEIENGARPALVGAESAATPDSSDQPAAVSGALTSASPGSGISGDND